MNARQLLPSPATPAFWPGVIACVATLLVLVQLDPAGSYPALPAGPSITVDEVFNTEQGFFLVEGLRAYHLALLDPRSAMELFSDPSYLPDHPPLGRLWLGIHHALTRWLLPPADPAGPVVTACARSGSATAYGLTVFLVGWSASHWWSRGAGAAAALALACLPRVFGHAHIAALESTTNLACTVALLASLSGIRPQPQQSRAALLAGIAAGLALLTKIQAILWMPILGLLWLSTLRRLGWRPFTIWFIATVAVFCAWPWLWLDPLEHVKEYLGRTTDRAELSVWYLGQRLGDRAVPWHFPWVIFATTTPWTCLLLALPGAVRRGQPPSPAVWSLHREGVLIAAVLLPLLVFSLPGIAVYDQERLFLIVCPPCALLAGRGWQLFQDWRPALTMGRNGACLAAALCLPPLGNLISVSPCFLSTFNVATAALPGAAAAGLETTYWGDSLTRELLTATARLVPAGSTVGVAPVLHQFQVDDLVRQSPVLRRSGLQFVPAGTGSDQPRWRLIFWRRADLPEAWRVGTAVGEPRYVIQRQGVILAGLYEATE